MKWFTILASVMASLLIVGRLDAGYKLEVKVEGGLKSFKGTLIFIFQSLVMYIILITIICMYNDI